VRHLLLPDDVQDMYERLQDTDSKKRVICDFVAGMTDRYAVEFYSRLRETGASIFKPI
jgi:dGTPase